MPTTRPRLLITESEPVSRALDDAAKRWPDDRNSRTKLLLHLVEEGHRALLAGDRRAHEDRLAVIDRTSGVLTGMYETGYLTQLREDWPA